MKIIKRFFVILFLIAITLTNLSYVEAKTSNKIIFKDQHLFKALCKFYNRKADFTQEDAINLTKKKNYLYIQKTGITDLEGLQYFENVVTLYVGGNNLKNNKPLSKLNHLKMLDISDSLQKGTTFEAFLEKMGRIKNLEAVILNNDELTNMGFLGNMGYADKYDEIRMSDNKIIDISILKNATNLTTLDLSNNRIQDVSPLAKLDKLTFFLDLRDNCIIDYKPVEHLFDEMYKDFDIDNDMPRYDYYTNPYNFKFNGKMINFPYLTTIYKDEAYAEAKPLFEAFGGSATYDKNKGKLTCKYNGDTYVFTDFSKTYILNGKSKKMSYPMRHMQYDLAYVPTKDICKMLGFTYKEIYPIYDDEYFETHDDNSREEPILVEITNKEETK